MSARKRRPPNPAPTPIPASAPVDSSAFGDVVDVGEEAADTVADATEVGDELDAKLPTELLLLTSAVLVLVCGTVAYAVSELTHVALVATILGRIWKRPTPVSQQSSVWSQQ